MELWFVLLVSMCLAALLRAIFDVTRRSKSEPRHLPPGPSSVPVISGFLWLRKSTLDLEKLLCSLRPKLGPIITLPIFPSRPSIFIFSRSLAHKALIQNGAVFADRPKPLTTGRILTCNQHTISSAGYGDTWRILRRNLISHILHPSRAKSFSAARSRVLRILIQRLRDAHQTQNEAFSPVKVADHFRYAIFCLLVFMCFGEKFDDEDQIRKVEAVHRRFLLSSPTFRILNFQPWISKLVFRRRWKELFDLKKAQSDVIVPLIRARASQNDAVEPDPAAYIDSLISVELPEERKMSEEEIVVACFEFLSGGTDTTTTTLQWIMANLVRDQQIQTKLFNEILGVVGPRESEIKEEDLGKMEYLKAVVLEGLRRHPPTHFLLPHVVKSQAELNGYLLPANALINFMVADMGRDPEVWVDPMEFKPERFVGVDFDLSGTREIKMIPFGAGRRMCPGMNLALLHLEYFVANLVWEFEWREDDRHAVDLTEKEEFTVTMKNPLHALISPRSRPSVMNY